MNSLQPNFTYVAPQIEISVTEEIKTSCLKAYALAMQTLEESVADVAAKHPDSIAFARKLTSRLFDFIQAYAEVSLEKEGLRPNKGQIDLKVNALLFSIFYGKNLEENGGSVGTNLLSIRKVFKEGNLREQMYLPFKTTWDFTNEIFQDLPLVEKINLKLKNWKVNTALLRQNPIPYAYGPYARKSRDDKLRVANNKKHPIESRIPLSEREKRLATSELTPESTHLSADLAKVYEKRSKEPLKWKQGRDVYRIVTNAERTVPDPYLTAAEAVAAPGIAGISGTLDQILKMSLYFNMGSRAELEQGRLACLGWMLDGKHHTINEIMTSSKGFGLEYTPSPTGYQQIYSQDPLFVQHVQEAQQKRGMEMPDYYLSAAYVSSIAPKPQRQSCNCRFTAASWMILPTTLFAVLSAIPYTRQIGAVALRATALATSGVQLWKSEGMMERLAKCAKMALVALGLVGLLTANLMLIKASLAADLGLKTFELGRAIYARDPLRALSHLVAIVMDAATLAALCAGSVQLMVTAALVHAAGMCVLIIPGIVRNRSPLSMFHLGIGLTHMALAFIIPSQPARSGGGHYENWCREDYDTGEQYDCREIYIEPWYRPAQPALEFGEFLKLPFGGTALVSEELE